jgi:hypothetical protein
MVAHFNGHGVGGNKCKTFEVGMMEKVENGKRIASIGEVFGEKREFVRTTGVLRQLVEK